MSEPKHPLKCIKAKKKAAEDEINSTKQLAKEFFCAHIAFCCNNKQNCFAANEKTKSTKCDSFKLLENEELLETLSDTAVGLVISSKDVGDKFMQDIIGGGFVSEKNQKKINAYHATDATNELTFCSNTVKIIFSVGRRKAINIASNCATATPASHGLSGKVSNSCINKVILREDATEFIKTKANEQGESHATRFLREHNKLRARDSKAGTIEFPSYCVKRRTCRECCYDKGWLAETNRISKIELTKRNDANSTHSILSWSAFLQIWDNACSHMCIRPPSRDACGAHFKCKMVIKGLKQDEQHTIDNDDANHQSLVDSASHAR